MKHHDSVRDLYPIALWEGEGMGTAYEYSAKLKMLRRVVGASPPARVMIAGLPEAYGVGMDLALLAALYGSAVVVADDRPEKLETFAAALRSPPLQEWVDPECFELRPVKTLAHPVQPGDAPYDLWVTTSAIQRLKGARLNAYLAQARDWSLQAVLLAPNADNKAHTTLTRLDGFTLAELTSACKGVGLKVEEAGYVDLPPFPPGISRSAEAKEKAAESPIERLAMGVLEGWARGERTLPRALKRRYSHLVYVDVR
ncbi:MAG: hypothetical protein ISS56_10395 [Anaerolineae bacterium]|nr:hypothetical protein [Anaerolineae bacterium]